MTAADPSALLGDYLLRGWTMLGDVCPNADCCTPLMRSKDRTRTICVVCEQNDSKIASAVPSMKKPASEPVPAPANATVNEITKPRAKDPSAILGQYLLSGWAMMNDACPQCYSPLMRTVDKSVVKCVVCEQASEQASHEKMEEKKANSAVTVDKNAEQLIATKGTPMETPAVAGGQSTTHTGVRMQSFIDQSTESIHSTIVKCCSLMNECAHSGWPAEIAQYKDLVLGCLELLDEFQKRKC